MRSKMQNDKLSKLEKLVDEHEEALNRAIRELDGKANKKNHNDLVRDVEKLEENFKHLLDQVNNIKMPSPVEVPDDTAKYQALERMLVAVEEKFDRAKDSLNKRVTDTNKLMEMIKEDVDKTIEEQDKQLTKVMSRANI